MSFVASSLWLDHAPEFSESGHRPDATPRKILARELRSLTRGQSIKQIASGLDCGKRGADDFADGGDTLGWRAYFSPR